MYACLSVCIDLIFIAGIWLDSIESVILKLFLLLIVVSSLQLLTPVVEGILQQDMDRFAAFAKEYRGVGTRSNADDRVQ